MGFRSSGRVSPHPRDLIGRPLAWMRPHRGRLPATDSWMGRWRGRRSPASRSARGMQMLPPANREPATPTEGNHSRWGLATSTYSARFATPQGGGVQ